MLDWPYNFTTAIVVTLAELLYNMLLSLTKWKQANCVQGCQNKFVFLSKVLDLPWPHIINHNKAIFEWPQHCFHYQQVWWSHKQHLFTTQLLQYSYYKTWNINLEKMKENRSPELTETKYKYFLIYICHIWLLGQKNKMPITRLNELKGFQSSKNNLVWWTNRILCYI